MSAAAKWFWMSFCDASRPKGERFLGVSVIDGFTIGDAILRSWELKANPGGEIAFAEISADNIYRVPPSMRLRLLNKQEAESLK